MYRMHWYSVQKKHRTKCHFYTYMNTHTHTPFTTQEKTILCFYELSFVVVACLFVFQFNFTSVISRTRAIHTIQLHDEINKQNQTEKETKKRNN